MSSVLPVTPLVIESPKGMILIIAAAAGKAVTIANKNMKSIAALGYSFGLIFSPIVILVNNLLCVGLRFTVLLPPTYLLISTMASIPMSVQPTSFGH